MNEKEKELKEYEKEKELMKEIELLLWEIRLWMREGKGAEDAKEITDKLWQQLIDKIEEYLKKEV